jgi:hypothetical protein
MKTQHTQGEWYINPYRDRNDMTVRNGKNGFVIAEVTKQGLTHFIGNEAEAEANLKLIAAAPELLQMVNDLKNCIQRLTSDYLTQWQRDLEAEWLGNAHELLHNINPDYNK